MSHLEGKRRHLGFLPSQNDLNLVFRNERITYCFTYIRIFFLFFLKCSVVLVLSGKAY